MRSLTNSADRLDAESKFAKVMNDLRVVRPFYLAVYESMERVKSDSVPTIGVSTNKIVYNEEFVNNQNYDEFLFINLHEIGHVCLMHVARLKNRDQTVWNIAADLFVNKILSEEFKITPGSKSDRVAMPEGALFCSSLDTSSECTEDIYEEFVRQIKAQQNNGEKNNFKLKYTGKLEPNYYGRDENWTFETTLTVIGGNGGNSPLFNDDSFGNSSENSGNSSNGTDSEGNGNGSKVTLNGKEYNADIKDSSKSAQEVEEINRNVLNRASVKYDIMKSKNPGMTPSNMEIHVDNILKSHVDWRKLLRKYCIKATSTDSSFSVPDKRMFYQRAIYPGHALDESNKIKGVKVCFDVSGSISDEDISHYLGQVRDLMKKFKIECEVIYWDAEVQSTGLAEDFNTLRRVNISGRGGTDPSVVFKYFDSKKCKIKPIVTIMFTDGYIYGDLDNNKWARKYKDTIWVMTREHNKNFKPKFGVVTEARYSDVN